VDHATETDILLAVIHGDDARAVAPLDAIPELERPG
jgi:hypothetical protein